MTLEEHIKQHGDFYSLAQIENKLNIPFSTLHKVKTSDRKVPKKYRSILIEFFNSLGKNLT